METTKEYTQAEKEAYVNKVEEVYNRYVSDPANKETLATLYDHCNGDIEAVKQVVILTAGICVYANEVTQGRM